MAKRVKTCPFALQNDHHKQGEIAPLNTKAMEQIACHGWTEDRLLVLPTLLITLKLSLLTGKDRKCSPLAFIHGCDKASSAPGRALGDTLINDFTKSFASFVLKANDNM